MNLNRISSFCFGALLFTTTTLLAQTNDPARMPEVVVKGFDSPLSEEQLIGENGQPEWTTRRRFATTRVYVIEPWQVEFEQWWKGKFSRDSKHDHLFQSELELGLPYRFQLDLYENIVHPQGGPLKHDGNQVELRYAFADWGKIPLNPTIYGEWKFNHDEADAFEVKLLLGEEIAPRWHWAFNAFYEQQVGDDRETEIGFAQGLSYTLIDQKLSAGIEMNLERASHRNFDGVPATEFLIGPSVQWRPTSRIHLDVVPLLGTTDDSPRLEAFVIFSVDFSKSSSHGEIQAPASTRAR